MKRFFLLTLASAALLGASAAPVKTYEVKSPDGRLALVLTAGERLSFTVARDGETLVAPSEMALTLSTGEVLGESPRVRSARRRTVSETIDAPLYRQSRFDAAYNELDLRLRGDYGVLARAYDDGVCYRFYTERDGELTIVDETAQLNFEGDPSAYIPYSKTEIPMRTSFENTYEYAPLSKFRTQTVAFMPVLVDLGERGYVLYTESDVEAYPGVYLTYDKEAKGFAARFAEYPTETSLTKRFQDVVERSADYIARVDGRRSYPWRIVAYAATATELPVNDMVWQTAEASRVADASWVRDGKIAWDWWNNWGVYGVDFKSGINTETYKYFIDFAAANGIEYVALDEGWGVRDGDVMHVVPEIDLPEIVSYAREKKVGIILWVVAKVLDDKLEEACRYYSELGVAGWKVDFIDRQDQAAVERVYRIADAAARYRMIVDFHGVYKPTGLQRTYPNVVNFEGVHGLEQMKWSEESVDQVTYDVTMPFIRMTAGPVDYTQGAMLNAAKGHFFPRRSEPMSQGTRCRQLAEYIVFHAPLSMLCDSPSNYDREPECTAFICGVPTVWDRTVALDGCLGEYAAVARCKGDVWYVGGLTGHEGRTVTLDLGFLGDGNFTAEIFCDGTNAAKYGHDYQRVTRTLGMDRTLEITIAPAGGFALRITRE